VAALVAVVSSANAAMPHTINPMPQLGIRFQLLREFPLVDSLSHPKLNGKLDLQVAVELSLKSPNRHSANWRISPYGIRNSLDAQRSRYFIKIKARVLFDFRCSSPGVGQNATIAKSCDHQA
jgi:hypothetical protein